MELGFECQRRLVEFEWVGQGPDQGYLLWCEEEGREGGGRGGEDEGEKEGWGEKEEEERREKRGGKREKSDKRGIQHM